MSADTLTRPDEDTRTDDGTGSQPPEMFHYVKKDRIVQSAVEGNYVVALCGETFPVTKTPKAGSPVCPDCKRIYDRLRK